MNNRKEIRKKLPHGSIGKIAKLAAVTPKCVSEWFSGKSNSEKIEGVVMVFLEQLAITKSERNEKLNALLLMF